jgi:hypothetical protein
MMTEKKEMDAMPTSATTRSFWPRDSSPSARLKSSMRMATASMPYSTRSRTASRKVLRAMA